ncbi:DUF4124 domain-containing protein [Neisseriaceae bacterium ESL0693]|nr:DUF4124 domain-containing protein [Neisseriaceae bacterium ESL0693]
MHKLALLALCAIGISISAEAKTYRCTDRQGQPSYSEQPQGKNCEAVNDIGGRLSITETPAINNVSDNNEYSSEQEKTRQEHIKTAQQNLDKAKQALEEGKKVRNGNERNYVKYQERIRKLEENVQTRQQELDEAQ